MLEVAKQRAGLLLGPNRTTTQQNLSMHSIILVNPHASGGRARKLQPHILQWCQRQNETNIVREPVQVTMPESIREALQLLEKLPCPSRVIIVGGDGTLNQMLPGLLKAHHEVGLVPYGSGNDCARAWGLHRMSWQQALAHALNGTASGIDIGRVALDHKADRFFHSSLALGFDASVGNRALAGPKFLRGLMRYLLATFRELAFLNNWPLKVEIDGQLVHEGPCLLSSALNTPTYGGGMPAVPHASINDGQLNVLIGGTFNRLQTLLMLPRLLIGKHLGHPRIQCHAFLKAIMTCDASVPVAADGETLGFAKHVQIECIAKALNVVKI